MKNRHQTTKSATPPGGPSTINGILYQMLWCLLRAVELYVEQPIVTDIAHGPTAVVLRLEPRDGGNVQELGNKTRRVIQLKTRSNHRTWSLHETIKTVLPDLYRAIDSPEDDTCYDFVTEGRMGRWQEVYSFFQSLGSRMPGDIPFEVLDNEHEIKFSRRVTHHEKDGQNGNAVRLLSEGAYTEASLFEEIVRYLRTTTAVPQDEPIENTRLNLWHLLSHFRFIGQLALRSIQEEIDEQLTDLVDRKEQIPEKRGALLELLLTHATRGDATIQTDALLRRVGLNVKPAYRTI
jgi:hypothetical protein